MQAYHTNILFKHQILYLLFILSGILCSCREEKLDPYLARDIDGNIYHTITIGEQEWMAENLKTTRYRNGDPVPTVHELTYWSGLIVGAYCNYNFEPGNSKIYGRLYNWHAVNDSRNIAPKGWHIPTYDDLMVLYNYLGGTLKADSIGGKLKGTDTIYWASPNAGATNVTGFTALPGGCIYNDEFKNISFQGCWWLATASSNYQALFFRINYNNPSFRWFEYHKSAGMSVRCIKDQDEL